jgi:branched-chain amino acid transport system substrate-binding protein
MKKSVTSILGLLFGTALFSAGLINTGPVALAQPASKGSIKIAMPVPLSGPLSYIGQLTGAAAQMGLEDYGRLVTNQGFKLDLQPEDDQSKADVAVAMANRLLTDNDVLAVMGYAQSGLLIPASEVLAKGNLALITPFASNPLVTTRASTKLTVNRVCGRDDVQGPIAAEFAVKTLRAKRIFSINDSSAYGKGLSAAFEQAATTLGAQITSSNGVQETEVDFSTLVNRIAADKPDLIYFGGFYTQAAALLKQLRQKSVNIALLGGDGLDASELQKLGGEATKNVYFTTNAPPLSALPAAKRFAARHKAKFNVDPVGYSTYIYDATRAVIQGISDAIKANKGERPSREQVASAIRAVKFQGLGVRVAFDENGDIEKAKYFVIEASTDYNANKVRKALTAPAPK